MATVTLRSKLSRALPVNYFASYKSTPGIVVLEFSPESTGSISELDKFPTWRREEFLRDQQIIFRRLIEDRFVCGTGSGQSVYCAPLVELPIGKPKKPKMTSTLSISQLIAGIRASLSIQIKELAEILQVQRPTIYAWIKEQSVPHSQSRERLRQIYSLAKQWDRVSHKPLGKAIHDIGPDNYSLFDFLKDSIIPEKLVRDRFQAISRATIEFAHHKPEQIKRSVSEIALEHGIDITRVRDQEGQIDVLSGKRVTLD